MHSSRSIAFLTAILAVFGSTSLALALDDVHQKKAAEVIARGVAYLRASQGKAVDQAGKPVTSDPGCWSPGPGPAITAFAVEVLLNEPDVKIDDPAVQKALAYIVSKVKPDGSIHDGILENYNTSICLSALTRVRDQPGMAERVKKAQDFLRSIQWAGQKDPAGRVIDETHPWYGGTGYGKEGRPDLSNLQTTIQGLYDSGMDCKDPVFQRALVFLTRCQGTPANNLLGDRIVADGGAIYATSSSKDKIDEPESKAGILESEDGKNRLQTYGSMTYALFKCYLYAQMDRTDPRVVDAYKWIQKHWNLEANAGMPKGQETQGYYNYLLTLSRALKAWGSPTLTTSDGKIHDWASELVDKLAALQKPDGSFSNAADRWQEGDPNLVTCYALIALQTATR